MTYPTVFTIDGLDECLIQEERTTLINAISTTTGAGHSSPLKFLITSRPEVPLARVFNTNPVKEVSARHSLDDEPDSRMDVAYFLSAKFDEIKRAHPSRRHIPHDWPSSRIISDLVRKSSGQFIYPATIVKYLWSPKHSPTLRLDIILQLQPQPLPADGETPFGQIDALYRHILLSCDDVELALRIIGVCLVSTGITDIDSLISYYPALTKPEYIEAILCIHPGDVQRGLEDLGSLVEYKGDEEELRVLHASLFDFLLDPSRCYGLPFDLTAVHIDLALWYSQFDSHCEPMANPWHSGE